MLPKGLLRTNEVFFVLFAFGIAYHYFAVPEPPRDIFELGGVIGELIPLAVLGLTIVAAKRTTKRLARAALVGNVIVCLSILSLLFAILSVGMIILFIPFIPFFVNVYFLFRYKSAPDAL